MTRPHRPVNLAIGVAFVAAGMLFWLSGNGIGFVFFPVGIAFVVLAFPPTRPRARGRAGSSDGGGSSIGATGDGSASSSGGRADDGGRPDPSPSHDGGWGGSDGGGSSDGGGGGGGD